MTVARMDKYYMIIFLDLIKLLIGVQRPHSSRVN
ncbi:hypothetical protein F-S17_0462 [Faustovirus]|nr:hypothetical protein F-LCD7_0466 [Faustovirus]QJX72233.1 hypothetical protein F-M6_0470 [Faustovirus]QJX72728.1 hypothetical protein F-S17_0462 [Faustovirus]QJX73225.1 hypothetical protein F-VV57_0464 [Faustovirus]QJX73732.1 hypothetical protein F-VV63_0466 [Faustovirus]